jgi:glycine oxidase
MDETLDILVVGAGLIGLGIARHLAGRGLNVKVVDAGEDRAAASRVAGGMLSPAAEAEFGEDALLNFQQRSLDLYPDFIERLEEETGLDIGFHRVGSLLVARDRDDAEALDRFADYQKRVGLEVERLSRQELLNLQPGLKEAVGAIYCPNDAQVDNTRLLHALKQSFEHRGGTIIEGIDVDEIEQQRGKCTGVLTEGGESFRAEYTFICAGAYSGFIEGIPELNPSIVRPVKGEIIRAKPTRQAMPLEHVIRTPDAYLVPHPSGAVKFGASSEERGFDDHIRLGSIRNILKRSREVFPGVDHYRLDSIEVGYRPTSRDGNPLVGPSKLDGLSIATGHGRNGVLLTPATVGLIGSFPGYDVPDQLNPGRFG